MTTANPSTDSAELKTCSVELELGFLVHTFRTDSYHEDGSKHAKMAQEDFFVDEAIKRASVANR